MNASMALWLHWHKNGAENRAVVILFSLKC